MHCFLGQEAARIQLRRDAGYTQRLLEFMDAVNDLLGAA